MQQAGFMVLYKTAMPSILIELDFISNPVAEAYMMSADGQNTLASSIVRAFGTYKTNYERESVEMQQEVVERADETPVTPQTPANSVIDKNKGVVFKVQFATRNRPVDNPQTVYKGLQDIDYYEHNGMYKYTAGCFATRAEADDYLIVVQSKGYTDAFVVRFENGVRK